MTDTQPYIKWVYKDGKPAHGGQGTWPLPTLTGPGEPLSVTGELSVTGDLVPCSHGLHLCRLADATKWIAENAIPYLVQYRGELIAGDDKVVVREARLVQALVWNDRVARLFAADCAERALSRIPAAGPRSHAAVKAARLYARGRLGSAALSAALSAAWSAADAADAADAAGSAAWSAVWSAARSAADAALSAAWSAADAAGSAARSAEREWQGQRLWFYLTGHEDPE